ncbi:hypothetical protein PACTADRAFT_2775 [Pachysolen tannophilus NRRL Y-2460]|uniref:PUM-HD domain-containing protein n=1 Tax=Pachysolen tannophilus NRRL Y-2460 TaxID=669874 RepID=A0A1E4TXI9_PACTA|nr:hypothetical protein PACTADRAFT_2775 [Pachysolen tannophilus NRRL Y-2460]
MSRVLSSSHESLVGSCLISGDINPTRDITTDDDYDSVESFEKMIKEVNAVVGGEKSAHNYSGESEKKKFRDSFYQRINESCTDSNTEPCDSSIHMVPKISIKSAIAENSIENEKLTFKKSSNKKITKNSNRWKNWEVSSPVNTPRWGHISKNNCTKEKYLLEEIEDLKNKINIMEANIGKLTESFNFWQNFVSPKSGTPEIKRSMSLNNGNSFNSDSGYLHNEHNFHLSKHTKNRHPVNSFDLPRQLNNSKKSLDYEENNHKNNISEHINSKSSMYDWDATVNKIFEDDGLQTSIFLQQKLKNSDSKTTDEIFKPILKRSGELMVSRFGNFLIQRCFDYCTEKQIEKLLYEILGNVVLLSMDRYGCHVVQKAIDYTVSMKMSKLYMLIVEELVEDISETIICNNSTRVWQRIFEIRWSTINKGESTPFVNIIEKINLSLKDKWCEIAMSPNGCLIVQKLFENYSKYDQIQCINELLQNLNLLIKNQSGNWVIQHLLINEVSAINGNEEFFSEKQTIIAELLDEKKCFHYCINQFGSKVIETMLKNYPQTVDKLLTSLCKEQARGSSNKSTSNSVGFSRTPSISIRSQLSILASDLYGSHVLQYIFINGNDEQKRKIMDELKRYMVSLRGSKYGIKITNSIDQYVKYNNNNYTTS